MGTLASAAARATAKASRFSTAAPLARDRRRASDVVRVIASGVAAAPRQAPAGVAACSAATSAGAGIASGGAHEDHLRGRDGTNGAHGARAGVDRAHADGDTDDPRAADATASETAPQGRDLRLPGRHDQDRLHLRDLELNQPARATFFRRAPSAAGLLPGLLAQPPHALFARALRTRSSICGWKRLPSLTTRV